MNQLLFTLKKQIQLSKKNDIAFEPNVKGIRDHASLEFDLKMKEYNMETNPNSTQASVNNAMNQSQTTSVVTPEGIERLSVPNPIKSRFTQHRGSTLYTETDQLGNITSRYE